MVKVLHIICNSSPVYLNITNDMELWFESFVTIESLSDIYVFTLREVPYFECCNMFVIRCKMFYDEVYWGFKSWQNVIIKLLLLQSPHDEWLQSFETLNLRDGLIVCFCFSKGDWGYRLDFAWINNLILCQRIWRTGNCFTVIIRFSIRHEKGKKWINVKLKFSENDVKCRSFTALRPGMGGGSLSWQVRTFTTQVGLIDFIPNFTKLKWQS